MDYSSNGSPSALSIIAGVMSANPVMSAILAGSFATIVAGTFIYHEYQHANERKRINEIEKVNQLYRKHLYNISIPELNEKIHLPAIFTVNEETKAVSSMHFTFEQIEEMNNISTEITDPDLLAYSEHISDTINRLKKFYLKRSIDNDVTAGVLSWVLYILTTYCRNFQGFAIDIAFLKHIERFISEYASIDGTEISENFSWLVPSDNHLLKAINALQKHRNTRSLRNSVAELGYVCRTKSSQLLRIFTQLTVKDPYKKYARFVSILELEQGILHTTKINKTVFGVAILTEKGRRVKSFFEPWIRIMAAGYLSAIGIPDSQEIPEIQPPENIFIIPEEKSEIRYALNRTTNFLTRESRGKKLDTINDPYHLHDRLEVYQNIATLIHQLTSLLWLCMQILRTFRQMGSIYVENPYHLQRIFHVLQALCQKITETSGIVHNQTAYFFGKMAREQIIHAHRVIPDTLLEYTSFLQKKIQEMGMEITNIHKGNAAMQNAARQAGRNITIKHIMSETASRLEKAYHIPTLQPGAEAANDAEHKWDEEKKWDENDIYPDERENIAAAQLEPLEQIALLMTGIQREILHQQAAASASAGILLRLYTTLLDLQKKSIILTDRPATSVEQRERSRKITLLTLAFCQRATRLLSPVVEEAINHAEPFAPSAWAEAASGDYASQIDAHQNLYSRILFTFFKCRFFQTDTRKKVTAACKAFDAYEQAASVQVRNVG